ncbi:benzoate membrane transport protein [Frankineae bacterium MT45]|nr:benzoate membrane transport protein [Frankineae bacterium MT45]
MTGPDTESATTPHSDRFAPLSAGLVTALVGFTSSFTVVLAGLRAVGASQQQAASGLLALSLTMGMLGISLSLRHRIPISIAWSTPGAALLGATGKLPGGFPTAVAGFLICGALILISGLFAPLRRLVEAVPSAIANALLAGVLLELCLAPVTTLVHHPGLTWPIILTWALLYRFARRWAVPAAMMVAIGAILVSAHQRGAKFGSFSPTLALTAPHFAPAAVTLGISLFVVTMASQNLPGVTVLQTFGYQAPLASVLRATGVGTLLCAAFGGQAVNLAAISAALCVGPDGGRDPQRRWRAAAVAGGGYVVLGLLAGVLASLVVVAPSGLVETVAGLALLATLANSLSVAMAEPSTREPAILTFLVTASGITVAKIGAPFWGLVAGLALLFVLTYKKGPPHQTGETAPSESN